MNLKLLVGTYKAGLISDFEFVVQLAQVLTSGNTGEVLSSLPQAIKEKVRTCTQELSPGTRVLGDNLSDNESVKLGEQLDRALPWIAAWFSASDRSECRYPILSPGLVEVNH